MRRLAFAGAGLLLLLAAALLAAVGWAERELESPELRAHVEEELTEALGREVGFERLRVGLLPPAVVVERPFVAGETPSDPPFVEARAVSIRMRLLPLLERDVVIRELVIDAPQLHLVRTADRILLPSRPEEEAESGPSDFRISLERVRLREARVLLEDRSFDPWLRTVVERVDARLRFRAAGEPIDVEARARSGDGSLALTGWIQIGRDAELSLSLDAFPIAPLDSVLPADWDCTGAATGELSLRGRLVDVDRLEARFALDGARIAGPELALEGRADVGVVREREEGRPVHRVELDASGARFAWAGIVEKRAGAEGRASLEVRRDGEGPVRLVGAVELGGAKLDASVDLGPRVVVSLGSPRLELDRYRSILVPLRAWELSGALRDVRLELRTGPLELRGRVRSDGVALRLPESTPVELRGTLAADGNRIRGEELALRMGEAWVPVELAVEDVASSWCFGLRASARDLETDDVLSTVGRPGVMYGTLALDLDLAGRLLDEEPIVDTLEGRVALDVVDGRIPGVSFLRAAFDRWDEGAAMGWLRSLGIGRPHGQPDDLDRYYGDRFERLSGAFRLAGGVAHTSDLKARYPFYRLTAAGSVGLRDLALDARGELLLAEALAGDLGAGFGLGSAGLFQGVVIPLPAIRGTLTAPELAPDWRHFWLSLLRNVPGAGLIDKALGAGRKLLPRR